MSYEFWVLSFYFRWCRYSSVQLQWFCLSGSNGRDVFVLRSATCGYEGYCLSGKMSQWIEGFHCDGYFCIRGCFWLEKPNFHNRRIYSAAWIVVRNLPERQYFSIDGAEYPSVDLLVWIVKSTNYSPLKIRGVPPKVGGCYEWIDNWQIIMDNNRRSEEVGSGEIS